LQTGVVDMAENGINVLDLSLRAAQKTWCGRRESNPHDLKVEGF
jgi:hypothetical protein